MRGSLKDLPVTVAIPEAKFRDVDWSAMTVEMGEIEKTLDPSPLLRGLPDNRCQCPHWGYVIKGVLHYKFADREEVCRSGDVYYAPPGHTPVLEAGLVYVEFSPADKLRKTMAVLERNMAAAAKGST